MKLKKILLAIVFISNTFAIPNLEPTKLKSKIVPQEKITSDNFDFEGIVKLSNCSGAIIKFEGQPLNSNAYVLTNGHCLGGRFLGPGEVVFNKRLIWGRRMKVADKNMRFHSITATDLVYATMTGTDSAIYKLKETYNDLLEFDIRSFELSKVRPKNNTEIEIASGYWERGYRCTIDGFVHELREGDWTFVDSIRYSKPGCETIGGTSGSPIVESGTRTVVGINNTANESGRKCTMNNPCEVTEDGEVSVHRGTSYGQQTFHFYSCLNSNFEIDLNIKGCLLPSI